MQRFKNTTVTFWKNAAIVAYRGGEKMTKKEIKIERWKKLEQERVAQGARPWARRINLSPRGIFKRLFA